MFVRKYSAKYLVLSGIENSAENFRQLSEILSYKKWEGRDLVFDPTGSAIKVLMRYYPDAIWDQPSSEVLDKYLKSLEDAKKINNSYFCNLDHAVQYAIKNKLKGAERHHSDRPSRKADQETLSEAKSLQNCRICPWISCSEGESKGCEYL